MTICVAKDPSKLTLPSCTAIFTTIQAGLDAAAAGDDKTVVVEGSCGQGRCEYQENVRFPAAGIALVGHNYPIINGMKKGRTVEFCPYKLEPSSISGFEITGGQTEEDGAGIYAYNSRVSITDNCIHNNVAEGTGGGICIAYDVADPSAADVWRSVISGNGIYTHRARHGGGVGVKGDFGNSCWSSNIEPWVIIKSNVIGPDNIAKGVELSYGGGISVYRLPVSIDGNDVYSNEAASYGGGIAAYNVERDDWTEEYWAAAKLGITGTTSNLQLKQVQLNNNHVHQNKAWKGGGVAGLWFAVVNYSGNIIEENVLRSTQDSHGGGIYGTTAGVHRLSNNLITKNQAINSLDGRGGGIHASCNAVISFEGDNIVSENAAQNYGGGISLDNADMYAGGGTLLIAKNKVTLGMGKGGGIYACSSDSTDGGQNMKWQPCNHNNTLSLRQCIVEYNSSLSHGAGIAVEKDFAGFNAVQGNVTIEESIIRNNFATDPDSDGVYFRRTSNAASTDQFKLSGSLVEAHNAENMAGVRIDDEFGKSIIESNVLKENDDGLIFGELAWAKITSNLFLRNSRAQLRLLTLANEEELFLPDVEVDTNFFEGDHVSNIGVQIQKKETQKTDLSSHAPKIFGNDITGHTKYGMESESLVSAPSNYWGSPDGPTRPDGNGGGDKITNEVNPDVFSPNPVNFMEPSAPNLNPPQAPSFTPPGTPDCGNLSEKLRRRTTTQTQQPDPQTPTQPQNPPAGQNPLPPPPQTTPVPQSVGTDEHSSLFKTPDVFIATVFLGLLLLIPLILGFVIHSTIESQTIGYEDRDYIQGGLSALVVFLLLVTAYFLRDKVFPKNQSSD